MQQYGRTKHADSQPTPKYVNIKINDNNQRNTNTKTAVV